MIIESTMISDKSVDIFWMILKAKEKIVLLQDLYDSHI